MTFDLSTDAHRPPSEAASDLHLPGAIPALRPEDEHAARLAVTWRAHGAEDAPVLLEALGLIGEPDA